MDANVAANVTDGTISQNLQITTGTVTNTGTFEATNGGTLEISSGNFTNTDGTNNGTILANGGTVVLDNQTTITGGTLTSMGSGEIDDTNSAHLYEATVSSGTKLYVIDGTSLFLNAPISPATTDVITNNGTITVNKGGSDTGTGIGIAGNVELAGTGSIVLNAFAGNTAAANIFDAGNSNLTQDAGHTISGTGQITVNAFTNNGTVNANSSGNTLLLVHGGATYTNNNLLEATNGGILEETSTNISNGISGVIEANGGTVLLNGGSVAGGTLTSTSGSVINEQGNATLSNVTLSAGSNLDVIAGNNLFFASGSLITNNGTITVNNGATNNGTNIMIVSNVELAGTGRIVLNAFASNTGAATIADGSNSNLTQDANHTISGPCRSWHWCSPR